MIKSILLFTGLLAMLLGCQVTDKTSHFDLVSVDEATSNYTQYVNPFIGTDGTGHTFPGATYPFGMVQVSPDTNNQSWDHTSGYQYKDESIMGFSQNHLSGTGISDLGDVLLQPYVGNEDKQDFRSTFDKTSEIAEPGFYHVSLTQNKVQVELTASERVAFHKYVYTEPTNQKLYIDLQHGIINAWLNIDEHVTDALVKVENSTTISGMIETSSWVKHKTFFVISFDQPFIKQLVLPKVGKQKANKYILSFADLPKNQLQVKVALSTVSVDGAKNNLLSEVPHWNFDKVRQATKAKWNHYLSRVELEAPLAQKQIFYTGLYHLFTQPNITSDVDGQYRGYDDNIHFAYGEGHYSTFSLWDTYRAAHPLYTILVPEKEDEFINSLITQQQQQGFLPIWGLMNKETFTMIANHGIPVVVDAILKGIPGIDPQSGFNAVYQTASISHKNSDWQMYEKYGYYPFDLLDKDGESVSRTLEHTFDDWAVAKLAEHLGKTDISQHFYQRAKYYQNLFDPSTGFMRGKDSQGNWRPNFDPAMATSPMNNPGDYTEANAYQYSWAAQHDTDGMIKLFGNKDAFIAKLDEFFSTNAHGDNVHLGQEAMIGQYSHGNEPSHHIAYLYKLAGRADKTQFLVNKIYHDFYANTPDGLQGNEDCGQMSAWYIFSTLGFYPVDPVSGEYVLGAPQAQSVIIKLPNQQTFSIRNEGFSAENIYVDRVYLNSEIVNKNSLSHKDLMAGGQLIFNRKSLN